MTFLSDADITAALVSGVLALITGTVGMYIVNQYLEKRRQLISTKREQLSKFYSPIEILVRMNGLEFERYFAEGTSESEKEFIETAVWFPNNTEIRRIIMEHGHLLPTLPEEVLRLIAHINVWLSEYHLVYVKKEKQPPVFAGPKGYKYPREVDQYIFRKTKELRAELNQSG